MHRKVEARALRDPQRGAPPSQTRLWWLQLPQARRRAGIGGAANDAEEVDFRRLGAVGMAVSVATALRFLAGRGRGSTEATCGGAVEEDERCS